MSIKLAERADRNRIFLLVVALLMLYVFVPRYSSFRNSFTTLRQADFAYIGLGIGFWLATFLAAAAVYKFIALRSLPYRRTLLVQAASGFTNRLVPLGAGAIALNVRFLIKQKHSAPQAGSLAALNNLLGFSGNAILLLLAILFNPNSLNNSFKIHIKLSSILIIAIVVCLVALSGIIGVINSKLAKTVKNSAGLLVHSILRRPGRLMLALLASMVITVCYTLVLYFMALAFNVHLSITQTLLVLTFGVLTATITPTPGGIGGAEAALVAGLIAIGVSSHQALTIALTYRFSVYWLPILPGLVAFQFAVRRRYI